jgi:hypothetical protein
VAKRLAQQACVAESLVRNSTTAIVIEKSTCVENKFVNSISSPVHPLKDDFKAIDSKTPLNVYEYRHQPKNIILRILKELYHEICSLNFFS